METFLLKSGDDLSNKISLDAIRLDHDVSSFHVAAKVSVVYCE